jgi:pSer/pThr/pTyr-binding forkhead associated (FHA) protein
MDTQIQAKKKKKLPAFTVLKNGFFLDNIFLYAIGRNQEQIWLVGRDPDCNITDEHPTISRKHLQIHVTPHMVSVVDLSSGK